MKMQKLLIATLILVAGGIPAYDAHAGFWSKRDRSVRMELASGHVEMQVVRDRSGAMLLTRDGEKRWVFEGETAELVGESYAIVLRNRSPERIKVVVGVDGVNIYGKDSVVGRADGDTGSILSPWGERVLRGWQMDHATAQRFVFSPPEWSEGQGRTDSQIGVIAVHVYRERPTPNCRDMDGKAAPESSRESEKRKMQQPASPQIGTTSGDDVSSHVRRVEFTSRTVYPESWAEIDYGRCGPPPPFTRDGVLGMHLGSDPNGSLVVAVDAGSEAQQAGIVPSDLIVRIDTTNRPSVGAVKDLLRSKRAVSTFSFVCVVDAMSLRSRSGWAEQVPTRSVGSQFPRSRRC